MQRVYVVSDTGHDLTAAQEYGEICYLFTGPVNVFALDKMAAEIKNQLVDSHADDYFLTSGSTIANCIAFWVLINRFGFVNCLIYSFRDKKYELRTVQLREAECQRQMK